VSGDKHNKRYKGDDGIMPIQLSVKVGKNAQLVRKGLQDLRAEVPKIGRATIYEKLMIAKRELSKPPSRPKPPGLWDSKKQMLAYFRSGGFGKGIPYKPTGNSGRSWVLSAVSNGWKLRNKFAQAVYLFGNWEGERQSVIHAGRRPNFKETLQKHVERLPKTIQKNIDSLIKRVMP